MRDYAWIIDIDHQPDTSQPAPSNLNAKGMIGPAYASEVQIETLTDVMSDGTRRGQCFRMKDDDGNLYYSGRIIGAYSGFEPLDDFGTPNAGAVTIEYLDKTGRWSTL